MLAQIVVSLVSFSKNTQTMAQIKTISKRPTANYTQKKNSLQKQQELTIERNKKTGRRRTKKSRENPLVQFSFVFCLPYALLFFSAHTHSTHTKDNKKIFCFSRHEVLVRLSFCLHSAYERINAFGIYDNARICCVFSFIFLLLLSKCKLLMFHTSCSGTYKPFCLCSHHVTNNRIKSNDVQVKDMRRV